MRKQEEAGTALREQFFILYWFRGLNAAFSVIGMIFA
jgi:hypothetical protein